jgi:hypothetical protein
MKRGGQKCPRSLSPSLTTHGLLVFGSFRVIRVASVSSVVLPSMCRRECNRALRSSTTQGLRVSLSHGLPVSSSAVLAIFGGYLFEREWEPEWHRMAANEGPNDERRTKNSGQECPRSLSACLPISWSPSLLVSPSPCLPISWSPSLRALRPAPCAIPCLPLGGAFGHAAWP